MLSLMFYLRYSFCFFPSACHVLLARSHMPCVTKVDVYLCENVFPVLCIFFIIIIAFFFFGSLLNGPKNTNLSVLFSLGRGFGCLKSSNVLVTMAQTMMTYWPL
jgi:hypothetical protein